MKDEFLKIKDIHRLIIHAEQNWLIYLMNFVDNFILLKNPVAIPELFDCQNNRFDSLLASMPEGLWDELTIEPPDGVTKIPPLQEPWFVSPLTSGKVYSLVESPIHFQKRNIVVFKNFLRRV